MVKSAAELKRMYENGINISAFLREEKGLEFNSKEIIEVAYDLQAGSYIAAVEKSSIGKQRQDFAKEVASLIMSLCRPENILEAGIGEAVTFAEVLKNLPDDIAGYGFDLSWSRIAYAQSYLKEKRVANTTLCTGDLLQIPFADNSIDVVYTSHSIEPNRGSEKEILKELFRITRKYLVLLEPGYELADDACRKRMDAHGYCRNLVGFAKDLGYKVLQNYLFPHPANPLNPTALTLIEKESIEDRPANIFACPKYKCSLEKFDSFLFSPQGLVAYPVILGIPCLRIENGVFASHLKRFADLEK